MNHSDEIHVLNEHSDDAPLVSEGFDHERAKRHHPKSVAGHISNLRDVLKDMTYLQLRALANAWNVHSVGDRENIYEILFEACSLMIENANNPNCSDAIHRQIVTERFFGAARHHDSRDDCYSGDSSDSDCEQPTRMRIKRSAVRARSASPRVDLTAQYFDCPICLDRVPSRSTFILQCCMYEACKNCVAQNIEVQMSDRKHLLNCCNCGSSTFARRYGKNAAEEVEQLVHAKDMLAWKTNLALNAVPDCRQCTSCDLIQLVNRTSESFPMVACKACGHNFCFEHGDSHSGKSCPLPTSEQIDSEITICAISKPCPCCQMKIERHGGCPHMTCRVCGCSWCWTCGLSMEADGAGAERVELLITNTNNSKNLWSTLLFHIICFLAGPCSVFYLSSTCSCGHRNHYSRSQSFRWEKDSRIRYSDDSFLYWFLTLAVKMYGALQRTSQGQFLFYSYLVYAAIHVSFLVLKNICYYGYSLAAGFYDYFPSHSIFYYYPGPPQLTNQAVHMLFSLSSSIFAGLCVAVVSYNARHIFDELFHLALSDWSRKNMKETFFAALFMAIASGLLILTMPDQPDHAMWSRHFWIIWLICHMYMAVYNHFTRYHDFGEEGWSLSWSVLAVALNLVMTMDYFAWSLIAAIVLVAGYAKTATLLWQGLHNLPKPSSVVLQCILGITLLTSIQMVLG